MDYLKNIPFFASLSEEKLKKIANIVQKKSYPKEAIIFRENEPGNTFYIIKKGTVQVLKCIKKNTESVIAILKEGDFFGEMALIEESNRSATVKAIENCELILIERNNFQALIKLDNSIALAVMKTLGSRLREMDKRVISAEEESIIDGLSGLYTHKYFKCYLEKEIIRSYEHNETFSLIMLDIDNFKSINDSYGHIAGDYILKALSNLIKENVHSGADIVARYGGEEIVVVLPETCKEYGILVANRLRSLVENFKFSFNQAQINITISLGVSNYPNDANQVEKLIALADAAMYKAKESGKNRVFSALG